MIIPIGHDQAIRRTPWVTIGVIVVCTLVQAYAFFGGHSHSVLHRLGYVTGSGIGFTLVTSAFVHEGWLHLIGNMLFLFLAGSALEDRWGAVRYLVFYVAGAAAATFSFDLLHHGAPALLIGASGAVSAAMGAFLVCFARSRIRLWYWIYRSSGTFQMAAYFALPLWLAEQIVLTGFAGESGVAYNAHIGGFGFGVAIALLVRLLRPAVASAELAADRAPAAPPWPRDIAAVRAAPAIAPDPLRARPHAPAIVVVRPVAASAAPIVADAGADAPKLLR